MLGWSVGPGSGCGDPPAIPGVGEKRRIRFGLLAGLMKEGVKSVLGREGRYS
jgi:hypothetical protein